MKLDVDKDVWAGFRYDSDTIDLSINPYLSIQVKSNTDFALRIYLMDSAGLYLESNVDFFIQKSDVFDTLVFNFAERYNQIDPTCISSILFNFNPGGPMQGIVYFDDFKIGEKAIKPIPSSSKPSYLDTVHIKIHEDSIAKLEDDYLSNKDVYGDFFDSEGNRYERIELHYRGATVLQGMRQQGLMQRNWKVKVHKANLYQNRR